MGNVKYSCSFCGKTNTILRPRYVSSGFLGLGSTEVGRVEEIDNNADPFYRCTSCGRIYCQEHYYSLCCNKKVGWLSTKTWIECPKCGSTNIKKL